MTSATPLEELAARVGVRLVEPLPPGEVTSLRVGDRGEVWAHTAAGALFQIATPEDARALLARLAPHVPDPKAAGLLVRRRVAADAIEFVPAGREVTR